jgi:hypothetical protein
MAEVVTCIVCWFGNTVVLLNLSPVGCLLMFNIKLNKLTSLVRLFLNKLIVAHIVKKSLKF